MHFATVNYSENKMCPALQLLMKMYDAGWKKSEFPVNLSETCTKPEQRDRLQIISSNERTVGVVSHNA